MLRPTLLGLVATSLASAVAVEVPLDYAYHRQAQHHPAAALGDKDVAEWSLDKLPDPNATDHLVFETAHSLLQHWPNMRAKNGHSIVPGRIPIGTLLYHGAPHKEVPQRPDWVATDPEHSYFFSQDVWGIWDDDPLRECWQLTLATTRPLKVVYFDGASAVELPHGSMDTQDLVLWGRSLEVPLHPERRRIQDLCNWGKSFGVDGFVRMEVDFEIVLCDFTSGVRVVSFTNIASQWAVQPVLSASVVFEAMNAGSWHGRFPGETRVQLDLAGLISFYDAQLVPSLVATRAGQERRNHRVRDISSDDLSAVRSRLSAALKRSERKPSGIDWKTRLQVIVDRYAQRLELTRYLLDSSATEPVYILDLANKTQAQLRVMLTPYLLPSATPTDPSDKIRLDWTIPVYKLCATTHAYSVESELDSMTDAEKLLLRAVRGTGREICRVVTKMWAAGVYAGIDPLLNAKESPDIVELTQLWNAWAEDLNRLMAWLDWSVWVQCDPRCDPEEICYLHPWPPGIIPEATPARKRPFPSDSERPASFDFDFRTRVVESRAEEIEVTPPRPRCVSRASIYELLWFADG